MRIACFTQFAYGKKLGGSKVLVELGEELNRQGHETRVLTPFEFLGETANHKTHALAYAQAIQKFTHDEKANFDVFDVDCAYLQFARRNYATEPLLVSRSVLLTLWLESEIKIPERKTLRSLAGKLLKGRQRQQEQQRLFAAMRNSFREADLVNIANTQDKKLLVREGISPKKILVQPYGIDSGRRALFDAQPILPENSFRVAFVGTYDERKGRCEFPRFVRALAKSFPQVRVVLLGTYKTEQEVKADFPSDLVQHIEVLPAFEPEQLPALLAACTVGIFPSHLEAFGFGVLEMLATGLPVIAYNSPGPPEMLPPEWLVPRGDWQAMAARVSEILTQEDTVIVRDKQRARELSRRFNWQTIAQQTAQFYEEALQRR